MDILPACIYMCVPSYVNASGMGPPGTEVTDSCEPPCGYWDSRPGPLRDQPLLPTTKPFLQHLFLPFEAGPRVPQTGLRFPV